MTIILQRNASERNCVNKSITNLISLNGELRTQTSISDPVITVDLSEYNGSIVDINYLTIADFGRKYFVTEMRTIGNSIFEISAHCDVLTSFKDALLRNFGIISRNENNFNLYLDDGDFHVYQNPIIDTVAFNNGFDADNPSFVLITAGKSSN